MLPRDEEAREANRARGREARIADLDAVLMGMCQALAERDRTIEALHAKVAELEAQSADRRWPKWPF